jgi:hypothetical protein
MRRERILLLRSGRHLRVAMNALAHRFPGCHIGVVGTPGSQAAIEQTGIAPGDLFVYERGRFQPLAFFFSRTAVAARRWRYDRVAILWNDPDGSGQGNVDRTACTMSPRGYMAITPDGTVVDRAVVPQLRTELLRVAASAGVAAVLGVFLYLPALLWGAVTQVIGLLGSPAAAGLDARHSGPAEAGLSERRLGPAEAGLDRDVVSGFSRTGQGQR